MKEGLLLAGSFTFAVHLWREEREEGVSGVRGLALGARVPECPHPSPRGGAHISSSSECQKAKRGR